MSEEDIARVFKPTNCNWNPRSGGSSRSSGFGLSMCRDFVGQMGGSIRAESRQGAGTTVIMELHYASVTPPIE